ncbi:MAG: hypothetical protein ACRDZQ_01995 [Acidimicrobiales bacterium]
MAPTTEAVRNYQRRLAQLAAAHARAQARWQAAIAKRTVVVAHQDRLVAEAEEALHGAVADLATTFGPEVAANVVGMEPGEVRRLGRAGGRP